MLGFRRAHPNSTRGQSLVEFALVAPLFIMLLTGIISLGIGVFYQQQITNAAREAARYAAIHSATAQCPTVPRLPYDPQGSYKPLTYTRCDRPETGWPLMSAAGRERIFGLPSDSVEFSACWSGYRADGGVGAWDAAPPGVYDFGTFTAAENVFMQCLIGGVDPTTDSQGIPCQPGLGTTDEASAISEATGRPVANVVTVYACYVWNPPLAGFLLIPDSVTLRGVVSEAIQRQQ